MKIFRHPSNALLPIDNLFSNHFQFLIQQMISCFALISKSIKLKYGWQKHWDKDTEIDGTTFDFERKHVFKHGVFYFHIHWPFHEKESYTHISISISMPIYLYTYLCTYLPICLSIYLFINLSMTSFHSPDHIYRYPFLCETLMINKSLNVAKSRFWYKQIFLESLMQTCYHIIFWGVFFCVTCMFLVIFTNYKVIWACIPTRKGSL